MLKPRYLSLLLAAGVVALGFSAEPASAQRGESYKIHDVCGVTPGTGKNVATAYQVDVFEESGVYTFCGKLERADSTVTFSPELTLGKAVLWSDYECLQEGSSFYPERFKARCLFANAEVGKGAFCERSGDKDGDGFVDGLKNVPVSLVEAMGYVVVGDKALTTSFVTVDKAAAKPTGFGDFGNVVLKESGSPKGLVARSYAHNHHFAEKGKEDYKLVTQTGRLDVLRNYYVAPNSVKGEGQVVTIGSCERAQ